MPDTTFSDDNYCFVCGARNPFGLKLKFVPADGGLYTDFVLQKEYQGWDGVVHGGVLAAIMDDVQVNLAALNGYIAPTAEITTRLIKPVLVGVRYRASAKILDIRRNHLITTCAEITDSEGIRYCSASAKLIITGITDGKGLRLK